MPDFRYTLDGKEVEAFQVTADTRYQEKQWPDWMQSRYLMTIDEVEWLNISDVETQIPKLGWIIRYADGTITAVDYSVMEAAVKAVVDDPPERDEPTKVDEEGLIVLAAKLAGLTVPEFEAEQARKLAKRHKSQDVSVVVENKIHDENARDKQTMDDESLLAEVSEAYAQLRNGDIDKGIKSMQALLAQRVEWCNCPPGVCTGGDYVGCRQNSPLAQP